MRDNSLRLQELVINQTSGLVKLIGGGGASERLVSLISQSEGISMYLARNSANH